MKADEQKFEHLVHFVSYHQLTSGVKIRLSEQYPLRYQTEKELINFILQGIPWKNKF